MDLEDPRIKKECGACGNPMYNNLEYYIHHGNYCFSCLGGIHQKEKERRKVANEAVEPIKQKILESIKCTCNTNYCSHRKEARKKIAEERRKILASTFSI